MARADKGPVKPQAKPDPQRVGTEADKQKVKDNERQLKTGDDHRTPDMKKHHRGTFP